MFAGYLSLGLIVASLLVTMFGHGTALSTIILVASLAFVMLAFWAEQYYQRKIDEIDYRLLDKSKKL